MLPVLNKVIEDNFQNSKRSQLVELILDKSYEGAKAAACQKILKKEFYCLAPDVYYLKLNDTKSFVFTPNPDHEETYLGYVVDMDRESRWSMIDLLRKRTYESIDRQLAIH